MFTRILRTTIFALAGLGAMAGAAAPGVTATELRAAIDDFRFASIDGGEIGFADWPGEPVLVVNTASLCAFTPQYDALQALYDRYRAEGLVVLAVPSDDFRQELGSDAEVKDFCALTFGLDLPMTGITAVRGDGAHPFYRWLSETVDFVPAWNFNKVLIGADGEILGTWGSAADPVGGAIVAAVEGALGL